MDDEEYEAKFEEEKEKLVVQFKADLMKQKNPKRAKERFDKKFSALLKSYNTSYIKKEKSDKLKKRISEPMERFSQEIDKLVEIFKEKT